MAKLERTFTGDFDQLLEKIESGIANGSVSASLEDSADYCVGSARCSVRVFERYSYFWRKPRQFERYVVSRRGRQNSTVRHFVGRQSSGVF